MQAIETAGTLPVVKAYTVNSHLLLGLYGIIPFCLVVVGLDYLLFNKVLLNTFLPVYPAQWAFWAIVFNFPHIVSSLVTLADKEYIDFYKEKFAKALAVIVVGVVIVTYLVPLLFPGIINSIVYGLFFAFFGTYTIYHVLSQQFGIGMMLMKVKPTALYQWWRVTATIAASNLYFIVFARTALDTVMFKQVSAYSISQGISGFFIVLSTLFALRLLTQSNRKLGTWYVISNILMLYATWLFMYLDYTVFVIVIPRFVHDITAFIIYSTHDQNRNAVTKKNYFYRFLAFLPAPSLVICPLLAIGLANGIESGTSWVDQYFNAMGYSSIMQISLQVIFICSLFHYYIEAFVWKREAIHRHSVSFT